ncbi:flagellar export chaperone FlgN [Natranaerofaba carboxydovora]|uniref:flagellar export chaperone FlgN n=1 Tax=Natranaerofaba carboxydovora TaxID=2742683 RepID=UPI001F12C089|nr:flagellar export chaperone FlgN [Natranaerofaba carboxydovora]UMZ74997.1 FlgN protein [Natranaerofaba carboxydovora]
MFNDLIKNLEEQLATQKLLLEYAHEKKDLLVDGRINELEELLKKEEKIVVKSGKLEKHRESTQKELNEKLNLTGEDPTKEDPVLTDFIEASEGKEREKLDQLFEELTKILAELKELNQQNNQLIQQSLQYVNTALDLYTASENDPGTYSKDLNKNEGQNIKEQKNRRNIFDKRI